MSRKVKLGLKNVHYAVIGSDGSYGTPVAFPGAVSLSLDPQGDPSEFYADDSLYFVGSNNVGYKGDFEVALVTDDFHKDVLGEVEDDNGVLVEQVDRPTVRFALLFEFTDDVKARRNVFYSCTASRTAVASQTKTPSSSPITEKLTITASPTADGYVKASADPDADNYEAWYASVQMPDFSAVTT